jgi:hypothetical protein
MRALQAEPIPGYLGRPGHPLGVVPARRAPRRLPVRGQVGSPGGGYARARAAKPATPYFAGYWR